MNTIPGITKQVGRIEGRIGRVWFKHGVAGSNMRSRLSQSVSPAVSWLQVVDLGSGELARMVGRANI